MSVRLSKGPDCVRTAAPAAAQRRRGRHRFWSGQSVVEFGVTVPVLLLLFSGVYDLGRAYYAQVAANDAARSVARVLAGNYGGHGPDDATACGQLKAGLAGFTSVTCVFASHPPPYVAGTDYTPPATNSAVGVMYPPFSTVSCGPVSPCRGYSGQPLYTPVTIQIYYTYGLVTPFFSQTVPGGALHFQNGAQMVSNW